MCEEIVLPYDIRTIKTITPVCVQHNIVEEIYRVIQEESALLWEIIV